MSRSYIAKFYNRDRLALTSLSKCGHCTNEQLKNYVADTRIKHYVYDGYVKKEVFNKNNGERLIGYKLTNEGRKLLENEWGVKSHYIAQSIRHDIGIANKYFSLSQEQKETWKTETELRHEFIERLEEIKNEDYSRYEELYNMLEERQISIPDASYEIENEIEVCYEVITNSYGQDEILAKENYIEIMNVKYETVRV
ncbi:hypothetical protein HBE96_16505 [Clostridium sp. P21]|uniref:Uncharacterized protein n=1 Tax=Clostridium muellerianum TaxID=2716538 RepID=A0A7Y0EIR9_9CLOT|nr:hypothetical protein [Clostridium muellerianum]NMM64228.1 hypothetical protein [Clostridium muellerianum]